MQIYCANVFASVDVPECREGHVPQAGAIAEQHWLVGRLYLIAS
jgi:hypothetical protein